MRPRAHRFTIVRLASVETTQQEARSRAGSDCRSATIVVAGEQTAGRGRGGRSWQSPRGLGLWMTMIHRSGRPEAEWPGWTSAGALAVCCALERVELHPETKWPNDVLLSGKKVAGVLADTSNDAILLGVGINLLQERLDFDPALQKLATSVRLERRQAGLTPEIDLGAFLDLFLGELQETVDRFERAGPESILPEIWERSVVRDRRLVVQLPSGERVEGRAAGLGGVGQLRLETEGGTRDLVNGTLLRVEDR